MADGDPMNREGIPALGDVTRRTAYEEVLDRLRHAILAGLLPPGTPLVLSELSSQLGVSRTPIREAIRDLAAEGLVDFDSYRSSIVHTPTIDEAAEVYELRMLLEPLAVRRAVAAITDAQLDRARDLHERMIAMTGDLGAWVELNRAFHAALMEPAAAPRLRSIITGLRNAAAIQVAASLRGRPELLSRSAVDHAALIDAYAARDEEAAVDVTLQHLRMTLDAIEGDAAQAEQAPAR